MKKKKEIPFQVLSLTTTMLGLLLIILLVRAALIGNLDLGDYLMLLFIVEIMSISAAQAKLKGRADSIQERLDRWNNYDYQIKDEIQEIKNHVHAVLMQHEIGTYYKARLDFARHDIEVYIREEEAVPILSGLSPEEVLEDTYMQAILKRANFCWSDDLGYWDNIVFCVEAGIHDVLGESDSRTDES